MQCENTFSKLRQRLLEDEQTDPSAQSEPANERSLCKVRPPRKAPPERPFVSHVFPDKLSVSRNFSRDIRSSELPFSKSPKTAGHRTLRSGKRIFHETTEVGPADGVFAGICIGEALDLQKIHADWGSVMISSDNVNAAVPVSTVDSRAPTCIVSLDSEVTLLRMFGERDIFLFRFGCFVAWGLSNRLFLEIKSFLIPYVLSPLPSHQVEQDDMLYCNGSAPSIRKDRVVLATSNAFERMAHSYAFAQSIKLTVFETSVDGTILKSKSIPEEMGRTGKLPKSMDSLSVAKLMGQLFVQRCHVNLHTDILDTPEIFWEFDEYEDQYGKTRKYLDIGKRVEILNHRLEIVKDLYEMLQNEVQVQHANYLEWIVIILILIEVLVELFRLFVDYSLRLRV